MGPSSRRTSLLDGGEPEAFILEPGTRVGRYVLLDALAAGGMGAVYSAHDSELARRVAIKVLRPEATTGEAQLRLIREAQAMARLSHPNVVAVYDVGTAFGGVFIAMELVEGVTASEWCREKHPWREVVRVFAAAGRGLAAAHATGLIHRDFKLSNVLMGKDGRVLVTDFGIARVAENEGDAASADPARESSILSEPLTQHGSLLGTVGYMSPERAFKSKDDARSDQFSFAVALYRALYGVHPFDYTTTDSYFQAILAPPRPPPEEPRVPSWVRDVVLRGLRTEPEARFASMPDLLAALLHDPTPRRRRTLAAAFAAVTAVSVGLGYLEHGRVVLAECRAPSPALAEAWNDGARANVVRAVTATGVQGSGDIADRVVKKLDSYAAEWATARTTACEATRVRASESLTTMEKRYACLDESRAGLSALVALLSHADTAIARRGVRAAYDLRPLHVCLEPGLATAPALPGAPLLRSRVSGVEKQLTEVGALHSTGKFKEAIALVERTLPDVRAIPYRRGEAQLLLLRGTCENSLASYALGVNSLEEAMAAAEASGSDLLAAEAAARVAWVLSERLSRPQDSEHWLAIARGILERTGPNDMVEVEVMLAERSREAVAGRYEQALEIDGRRIQVLERLFGADNPRVVLALENEAIDLIGLEKYEEAVVVMKRAIEQDEQTFGPNQPRLATAYNNLGVALGWLGRFDEGEAALAHSMTLGEKLGRNASWNAVTLASVAVLQNRKGDAPRALDAAKRGMVLVDASEGDQLPYLPTLLVEQGHALLAQGDVKGAFEACDRAALLQEKSGAFAPDQAYSGDALTCRAEAEITLGKLGDATRDLSRALTLTRREWPDELSFSRFALARVLSKSGTDGARARELAETARRALVKLPVEGRKVAEIDRFIAALPH